VCDPGRSALPTWRIINALSTHDAQPDLDGEGNDDGLTDRRRVGSLKQKVSGSSADQDGQHTAPSNAVRARPCAARPPNPGRTDI
jgi:hypothetical protein